MSTIVAPRHDPHRMGRLVRSAIAAEWALQLQPLKRLAADGVTRILAVAFIVAELLDVLTTTVMLDAQHPENNPVSSVIIEATGFGGLLAAKMVMTFGLLLFIGHSTGRLARGLSAVAVVTSLCVVGWNLHVGA